ncbi:ArsR/SmtB family transcription factor [Bordetella avium]|nr:winged helix-turn-helix domain-containing protein [Bordetella avium]AZY48990.1 ArsR family transcriptional regulator [Bordetella avium]AZY54266.1 ArsR family transcriptional regulator [Bordetella avium]RIQ14234.1 ArsR family transcriptional regulator [Bordetella avium]RIQ18109.1 ArsR family transcriptional regulator [Bordetella avium]RIQ36693.1 ArsR family transcriptional regulator [Bordetella avium]
MTALLAKLTALANPKRLKILELLAEPGRHFGPGCYDQAAGVCGLYLAQALGISPPTASSHLKLLEQAGFLTAQRIGKFTYFKRTPGASRDLADTIRSL